MKYDPVEKLNREMKIRHFSRKTIKSYTSYITKFLNFVNKPIDEISKDDVKKYLETIKDPLTTRVAIASLKFFFSKVVRRNILSGIEYPKRPFRIPIILSRNEIKKMIEVTKNPKHKLILKILYGCGLRVSELVKIKINNIDLEEGLITIREGKGRKDRYVMIPKKVSDEIKDYIKAIEGDYLFPGVNGHLTIKSIQKIVQSSAKKARISKKVTPHTLRHSFATHLLENGTDIRIIQKLLGHKRLETTQIYTQISTQQLKKVRSPLDDL